MCIPKTLIYMSSLGSLRDCEYAVLVQEWGWGLEACVKNHCGLRLHSLFVVGLLPFVPGFGFVLLAPALHVAVTEATSRNCCG